MFMHAMNRPNRVLVLVFLLFLLLCTGCAADVASKTPVAPPTHVPASCPQAGMPSVVLFVRQAHAPDKLRCLSQRGGNAQEPSATPQLVAPPIPGVARVCAYRADASVAYASYEDPQGRSLEAFGSIDLHVLAGTCQSVQQAVALASITVTSVWINPFYGGGIREDHPTTPSLIRQVAAQMCAQRVDFFTIWTDGGQVKGCYANAGRLSLADPLKGVTKVCSGNNEGGVLFHATQISGIDVNLEPGTCVTMATLLHESSIKVDTILIAPAP